MPCERSCRTAVKLIPHEKAVHVYDKNTLFYFEPATTRRISILSFFVPQGYLRATAAQVTISQEGGPALTLQPISIARPDTTRYSSDIQAYYVYPFRPQKGKKDALTVTSQLYGIAKAALTMPDAGLIIPQNELLLKDPWNVPLDEIGLSMRLSAAAKGYLVRFYLEFEVLDSTGWRTQRVEVPVSVWRTVDGKLLGYFFPEVQRRITPTNAPGRADHFVFLTEAYQETIQGVALRGSSVRFKQAIFFLIQFDEPLYNYYTNITGGVGVFGSLSVDSAVVTLPEHFPPRRY